MTAKVYSLQGAEVKRVIEAKLNWSLQQFVPFGSGQPYDEDQWIYYHLNRNYFNVGSEIKTLTHVKGDEFKDNFGKIWKEVSSSKNKYHMPPADYARALMGDAPYSRKFLQDDDSSDGPGGEFEMIIRHDGVRIGANINATYQETYNFGRTRNMRQHYVLDMAPHGVHSNYTYKSDLGSVTIIEENRRQSKPQSDSKIIQKIADFF